MKRSIMRTAFLATLLALLFPVSTTAKQLYVIGDNEFGGWHPEAPMAMVLGEDGITNTFEVKLSNPSWWTVCDGSDSNWDIFNSTYRYGVEGDIQSVNVGIGEYKLVKCEGTMFLEAGEYTISINSETMAMTISGIAEEITINSLSLVGTLVDTWLPNEGPKFTPIANEKNKWQLEVKDLNLENKDYEYKVTANETWGVLEIPRNGNSTFTPPEGAGKYTLTFIANIEEGNENVTVNAVRTGDYEEPQPVKHVYSIAGVPEKLFGAAWDATNTSTDMTLAEGIYTWTSEEISLTTEDRIEFKVVEDHAWTVSYPERNYEVAVPEDGNYLLTITFNPESKEVKATLEVIVEPAEQIETMYMVGDFTGGWPVYNEEDETTDWSMAKAMTQDEENPAIWTLAVKDFKVEFAEGETSRTYEYKATANKKWGLYELPSEGNYEYVINEAGIYDITFKANTEAHTLAIEVVKQEEPVEQIETMYMVGDFTGGWPVYNEEDETTDWSMAKAMTQDEENPAIWTLAVKDFTVEFAEGETSRTYEYKATANKKWLLYELPSEGNYEYVINEAGIYDITFTANTEEHTLAIEVVKQEEPVEQIETMYMVGDFTGGWPVYNEEDETTDWSNAVAMTQDAEDLSYWTLTVKDFKVEFAEGETSRTYQYKATANKKWGLYELPENGNYEYVINEAGIYDITFTANTEEHTLAIEVVKQEEPAEQIETMYMVGDFTGGWPVYNEEDETTDWSMAKAMTQDEENPAIWTLAVKDFKVEFAEDETSRTYQYKATANKKWGLYELPENGNYEYVINEAGIYDITFTANTEEHTLAIEVVKQQEPPTEIVSMSIVGDLTGGWPVYNEETQTTDWSNAVEMIQDSEASEVWTKTIEGFVVEPFEEGQTSRTYEWKVFANHDYTGYQLPANGNNNYVFNEHGTYNLYFTALTHNHMAFLKAVNTDHTYTVAGEFVKAESGEDETPLLFTSNWNPEDTKFDLKLNDKGDHEVIIRRVALPAGTILYKVCQDHGWDVSYGFDNGSAEGNADYVVNEAGTYDVTFGFDSESKTPYCFLEASNTATGIETITAQRPATVVFNLNGQRVNRPAHGIYIVNGRKVMVK